MNICVVCGTSFLPTKGYKNRKTCSDECFKIHMRNLVSNTFIEDQYKQGNTPFNKGKSQQEWMSDEGIEKCKNTYIHKQNCVSPLSKIENRYLPHNTKEKGTIVKRQHIHTSGKNKGKVETEYYINIDWKGNRKPNNLYKRFLWEYYHQQDIPKGYIVYCIDGNPNNIEISNLKLITRAELLKLNRCG